MAIRHKRKSSSGYTWSSTDLVDGQIGLNTVDGTLHFKKSDTTIRKIGDDVHYTSSSSAPSSPKVGDVWLDTNTGLEYTYFNDANGTRWVQFTGSSIPNNLAIPGTLSVGGLATLNSSSITGNETVNGNLSVVGTSTHSSGLILPKTSGIGIKVDTATPTFCWGDLLGPIMLRGGASNPTSAIFRTPFYAYQFATNDEVMLTYHVPHDKVPVTDLYLHTHWAHNSAAVTTGAITFTADVTFAKGFNQAAWPALKTSTWSQNASNVQYQHMVAETQISVNGGSTTQIDSAAIEVDGLILVRLAVTGNTLSAASSPFIFTADIHYQSTGIGTKGKAPNFYA